MQQEEAASIHSGIAPLGLISMNGTRELADQVDHYLVKWAQEAGYQADTFITESECPRFASGDCKGILKSTVRGHDLYILSDVGNYNCTYDMFGIQNHMSPDDHFQDLKRIIGAAGGKAHRINVIMPMLYGGRQHRRNNRESLDCALALKELEHMGVNNVITFDAHDPRVQNAVPLMGFDNVVPTYQGLRTLLRQVPDLQLDPAHFMIVSPDEGAITRNMYYSAVLGVQLGMFYKQRDYTRIEQGRNPIIAHEYLGESVEGKDIFIADDIISSGESILDLAYELKRRKAGRIFVYATYALFTNGLEKYDKAWKDGYINGILGTNLTYRTEDLKTREWFWEVNVSKYIAYFIQALNNDISIASIIDPIEKIQNLLKDRK